MRTIRALASGLVVLGFVLRATELGAQRAAPSQWVPVAPREPGSMSVGCPGDWEHREAGAGYFSCRDTQTGAFCNGTSRPSPRYDLAGVVAAARAELVARGFVVQREGRDRELHYLVYDDAARHRVVRIVRAATSGRRLEVTCGASLAQSPALLPVFLQLARAAR